MQLFPDIFSLMATLRKAYQQLIYAGPHKVMGWISFLALLPLSGLYGAALFCRRMLYKLGFKSVYHASVPVVSVGNLTVGGTGKTPMTDFLARWMVRNEVPVAIVSRGYGGSYSSPVVKVDLVAGQGTRPSECGDEPFLLATRNPTVPVYVARKRSSGVALAEAEGARVIILDDGFQHRAVYRDLDIVLLDSQRPFGNGCLLPAGPLREPKRALLRSQLLVMTRKRSAAAGPSSVMSIPTMHSRHLLSDKLTSLDGEVVRCVDLVGKSCIAFAGIAKPEEFFAALRERKMTLVEEIPLADHQQYDAPLLKRLALASSGCDALLTTEKDAVKLSAADFPVPCYKVAVELGFDDESDLDFLLRQLVEARQAPVKVENQ